MIEDIIWASSFRCEEHPPSVFGALPFCSLRQSQLGITLNAPGETINTPPRKIARCEFEQLNIIDSGEVNREMIVQGIRIIADVKERFLYVFWFKHHFESCATCRGSGKGQLTEDVDVNKVGLILREKKDLYNQD